MPMTENNQEKEIERTESSEEEQPAHKPGKDLEETPSEGEEAVHEAPGESERAEEEISSDQAETQASEETPPSQPDSSLRAEEEPGAPEPSQSDGGERPSEEVEAEAAADEGPQPDDVADETDAAHIAREAAESAPPERPIPRTEEEAAEMLPTEQPSERETPGEEEAGAEEGVPEEEPSVAEAPSQPVAATDETDEKKTRVSRPKSSGLTMLPDAEHAEKRWYVIHAHSGHENKVKQSLENRVKQENLEELVCQILIPSEEVAEIKGGKKRVTSRKIFPGYVLVEMKLTYDTWQLMRNTPGVTGFIGSGKMPTPLEPEEVESIFEQMRGEQKKPKPKVSFEKDEKVKIIEGPFTNFMGYVDEVNPERGKLKVMVEIFERLTSVELEFWQVEKS